MQPLSFFYQPVLCVENWSE